MARSRFGNSPDKLTRAIPFIHTRLILKDMIQNLLTEATCRGAALVEGEVLPPETEVAKRGSPT
jgi:hypothetical protein